MGYVVGFLRFWYDFLVGDDWRVAAGVAVMLGATRLLAARGIDAWWLMPGGVMGLLALTLGSVRRAPRREEVSRGR
jgi:hypothetical protein